MVHSVLTHRKPTWSLKGEKTAVGPAWAHPFEAHLRVESPNQQNMLFSYSVKVPQFEPRRRHM